MSKSEEGRRQNPAADTGGFATETTVSLSWSHGFEMKKSCSTKESKVVTTLDSENVLKASKEDSQEDLTEEQILINKKLLESGIEEEGLGWLEKKNIYKTINVSLDTAGSERQQRSSPILGKTNNSRAAKWIENSFENTKPDFHNAKHPKTKSKKDSEFTPTGTSNPSLRSNKGDQGPERTVLKSNHKSEVASQKEVTDSHSSAPKSSKVHYIKVQLEEESKKECNSSAEGVTQGLSLGKKRASQPEVLTLETPKKLKMDETNNGISSEDESPLPVELEMEKKKCNEPFKIRDIKTIVLECETRNRKWKETFAKYKCPARWGMPIVRNCSEKWDGKQIPPKLLHRFQKYLSSNDLTHPVFLPVKLQNSADLNKTTDEISSDLQTSVDFNKTTDKISSDMQSSADFIKMAGEMSSESDTGANSECRIELGSNVRDSTERSHIPGERMRIRNNDCRIEPETDFKDPCTGLENNLNAYTSSQDSGERMVLRNRNQQRVVISDEEEFSSDDSDDWLVKQKSMKKQKFSSKNKKVSDKSNKQLVLKLERCNINRGNGQEGERKNGSKNTVGFTGGAMMSSPALNQAYGNSRFGPDPDTIVCPICSLKFKKQFIESHATECASKTYKD